MQIGILEPDRFDPAAMTALQSLGQVICYDGKDLHRFLQPLNVLFVRLSHQIDDSVVRNAPNLRYVCSPTTGHTHLDESALASAHVNIISLRGEQAFLETVRATPEHTFGLMLALLRKYKDAFAHVQTGAWNRDLFRGEELYGQRVGFIGLGRVGFRVAGYCNAFGAQVSYFDRRDVASDGGWTKEPDVRSLIKASRIVVLCASYNNGNPPILGAHEVAMLHGRYLVNTARGELVDEDALLDVIEAGLPDGVATDVLGDEINRVRLSRWNAAAQNRNVIITPHIGGATSTAMARTEMFIAQKLKRRLAEEEQTR